MYIEEISRIRCINIPTIKDYHLSLNKDNDDNIRIQTSHHIHMVI